MGRAIGQVRKDRFTVEAAPPVIDGQPGWAYATAQPGNASPDSSVYSDTYSNTY